MFPISLHDFFTLLPIFVLVTTLFYLSNKEVRRSLEESRGAQGILSKDREILLKKLEESTKELHEIKVARFQELERAAEFGRMAQGLFHDLMTPLTSIVLHTEKLKEIQNAHKSVEKTIEASHRMAAFIKDIRSTLSREEALRICDLEEELMSVIQMCSYQARTHGVEIKTNALEKHEWFGSPTKIRQLFSNLILNAIDACSSAEKKNKLVEVEIKKGLIAVRDNGCGIQIQNHDKIFEPFFTTKSIDKGTGIGLAIVKRIVEKNLYGTIKVQSREGEGSAFTVIFPPDSRDPAAFPPPPHTEPGLV